MKRTGSARENQVTGKLVRKHEVDRNNNNIFNNRNISDHTNVTKFYSEKARPIAPETAVEKPAFFSNNLLNQLYDDNPGIRVAKNPSNLISVPRVSEKYECSSFSACA